MTLTEAVRMWSEAVADAYMYDLSGLESDGVEARQRALAMREIVRAFVARAEAAERAVQALVVWMHDSTTANWEPVMEALQEHADQGRVVRKLEDASRDMDQ